MYCKVVFDVPLDRDFDYAVPAQLQPALRPGVRVTAPFGRVLTVGLVTEVLTSTDLADNILIKEICCVLDPRPVFGSDLFSLAYFIKQNWGGPIGQILFSLVPPQPYFKIDTAAEADLSLPTVHLPSFTLTAGQQTALQALRDGLQQGYAPFLLTGPSFSGKTEVALRVAGEALAGYGQVLLCVPDVLAAQNFIAEIEKRFGDSHVFAWHSRMLISKKKKVFSAVSNGAPCVVIGTRSAGLLPFKNLRLAVMFSEESDNYKQEENKPYFHLRDVLNFRARTHGAQVIFASPSPSVEILKLAKEGTLRTLEIKHKIPAYNFNPQIKITEKKGEKSPLISDFLLQQLTENLQRGEPSLLILNRRGYSNSYYCLNCGAYAKCKKCGSILARENTKDGGDFLICKKCGSKEELEQKCPKCENVIFKSRGGGTQKIVTELAKLLPKARVLRLDSDTLKNKDGQGHEVESALKHKRVDIVVGTRLAAVGADGTAVTLSAILDADLELNSPDFRASEQFGQLLFALRGQCAATPNGRLIIQASSPDIYHFEPLLRGDYAAAAEEELALREGFDYPPYVGLVKVLFKSKEWALLDAETARVLDGVKELVQDTLGPVKCGKKTDTLKKQYVLLKTKPENYLPLIKRLDGWKQNKKAPFKVEADPHNFY